MDKPDSCRFPGEIGLHGWDSNTLCQGRQACHDQWPPTIHPRWGRLGHHGNGRVEYCHGPGWPSAAGLCGSATACPARSPHSRHGRLRMRKFRGARSKQLYWRCPHLWPHQWLLHPHSGGTAWPSASRIVQDGMVPPYSGVQAYVLQSAEVRDLADHPDDNVFGCSAPQFYSLDPLGTSSQWITPAASSGIWWCECSSSKCSPSRGNHLECLLEDPLCLGHQGHQ